MNQREMRDLLMKDSEINTMKPKIVLFVGFPGSGKSTLAKWILNQFNNYKHIELDSIREALLSEKEKKEREKPFKIENEKRVYAFALIEAKRTLEHGFSVILDDCYETKAKRKPVQTFCQFSNHELLIIEFLDLNKARVRNEKRKRKVPLQAFNSLVKRFQSVSDSEFYTANYTFFER